MSRRVAWLSCLLCCCVLLKTVAAEERPNVLLILVDDFKPSFGAYGDTWVHSTNLDRLAASEMRIDLAYCNQAVCAPSRNQSDHNSSSLECGRGKTPLRRTQFHTAGGRCTRCKFQRGRIVSERNTLAGCETIPESQMGRSLTRTNAQLSK